MVNFNSIENLDLKDKRVFIRSDLNVPLVEGKILNDARIRASLPSIKLASEAGAAVLIVSHLGRPKPGVFDPKLSLAPVAQVLSEFLKKPIRFEREWIEGLTIQPGEIVLCENVRFLTGEEENDQGLAKKMAALCDIAVMDAFATAHRAHASTVGVFEYAKQSVAGLLLKEEFLAIQKAMQDPKRPVLAIVGGAKISDKLTLLESLLNFVDSLIVGGGIANTFLAAEKYFIGESLAEVKLIKTVENLLLKAKEMGKQIVLPKDVVVASEVTETAVTRILALSDLSEKTLKTQEKILDVGPETGKYYWDLIQKAGSIIWNGPVGVFEYDNFAKGTRNISRAIAASSAYALAGGGETLAAVEKYEVKDKLSYLSTGGGAFLEMLEGKTLPGIEVLIKRAAAHHGN